MSFFGRKSRITDERIINANNKLYREGYMLALAVCFVSAAVKFLRYGFRPELIITEYLVLMLPMLYIGVKGIRLGLYADEVEVHDRASKVTFRTKSMLFGLAFGVGIALFFGVRNAFLYGDPSNRLYFFTLVFFTSLMIYIPGFVFLTAATHAVAQKLSAKARPEDEE